MRHTLPSMIPCRLAADALVRPDAIGRALLELTKPRLAFFSLITAMAAFAAAADSPSGARILATCVGAALAAGGSLSFNHWMERRTDALMERTRQRPIPSGRISATGAFAWSASLASAGIALLYALTTPEAAALAAVIVVLYAFVYTPLKRRTRWATEIGSIAGALPPVLGCAAAGEPLHPAGLTLAAVLLFWQMPHFYAIGWRYRRDYRAAGFPLLPATDLDGRRTARWSLGYTLCLVAVSLLPWAFGWFGLVYGLGAIAVGCWILLKAGRFLSANDTEQRDRAARELFFASLAHIAILSLALAIDQLG